MKKFVVSMMLLSALFMAAPRPALASGVEIPTWIIVVAAPVLALDYVYEAARKAVKKAFQPCPRVRFPGDKDKP